MTDSACSPTANAGELLQLRNCRLLRNHILHENVDLWVRHGRVIDPEKVFYDERRIADRIVDCDGAICAPGFIDMQINGGYGTDFSNITGSDASSVADGVRLVGRHILEHGVTSFCPTLVTSPAETYRRILPHIRKQRGGRHGATVLGTHLEGPFINAGKKGAHPEHCIRDFVSASGDDEEGKEGIRTMVDMYGADALADVSIVTLAPEKPGALPVIGDLTRRGIAVALGHSKANMAEGEAGVLAGSSLITHLFNAMLPVSCWRARRSPNILTHNSLAHSSTIVIPDWSVC